MAEEGTIASAVQLSYLFCPTRYLPVDRSKCALSMTTPMMTNAVDLERPVTSPVPEQLMTLTKRQLDAYFAIAEVHMVWITDPG